MSRVLRRLGDLEVGQQISLLRGCIVLYHEGAKTWIADTTSGNHLRVGDDTEVYVESNRPEPVGFKLGELPVGTVFQLTISQDTGTVLAHEEGKVRYENPKYGNALGFNQSLVRVISWPDEQPEADDNSGDKSDDKESVSQPILEIGQIYRLSEVPEGAKVETHDGDISTVGLLSSIRIGRGPSISLSSDGGHFVRDASEYVQLISLPAPVKVPLSELKEGERFINEFGLPFVKGGVEVKFKCQRADEFGETVWFRATDLVTRVQGESADARGK